MEDGWRETPFIRSQVLSPEFQPWTARDGSAALDAFWSELRAMVEFPLLRHSLGAADSLEHDYRYPDPHFARLIEVDVLGEGTHALTRAGRLGCLAPRGGPSPYRFIEDTQNGRRYLWDPLAHNIQRNPDGLWFTPEDAEFDWGADTPVVHPLEDLVLYELHVGSWYSPSGAHGTFEDAASQLAHLAALGTNGILLLPVNETEGAASWGYDPLTPGSVAARYGGAEQFKRFVRRAHELNIAIYLDVVYSQVALAAGALAAGTAKEGLDPTWFYPAERRNGPWGPRWNYADAEVRALLIEIALGWFTDFHVDGLFIEGLDAMLGSPPFGSAQPVGEGGVRFVQELVERVKQCHPQRLLLGEIGSPIRLVEQHGFHAQVDYAFGIEFQRLLRASTDYDRDVPSIVRKRILDPGSSPRGRILFSENRNLAVEHGRLPGTQLLDSTQRAPALGAVATLTLPGIPSIYQGQEFLAGEPPDATRSLTGWSSLDSLGSLQPGAPMTADPPWASGTTPASAHYRLYRDLIDLRLDRERNTSGLRGANISIFHHNYGTNERGAHRVIAYRRWDEGGPGDDVLVVLNLSQLHYDSYLIGVPSAGTWHVRLDTSRYIVDADKHAPKEFQAEPAPMHDFHHRVRLVLPPYGALVLSQDRGRVAERDWRRACVEIFVRTTDAQLIDHTRGFLIAPRIVATCYRPLPASVQVRIPQIGLDTVGRVRVKNSESDVVLLQLDETPIGVKPIPLDTSGIVPKREWESYSGGVTFRGAVSDPAARSNFATLALSGSSEHPGHVNGSPVISNGRVIGLITATLDDHFLAATARTIESLLQEHTQMVQIGEVQFPKTDPQAARFFDGTRTGRIEIAVPVAFEYPFAAQPQVVASLQSLDVRDTTGAHIHRLAVAARNVTRSGFDLVFSTWKESVVYNASAAWTAVGTMADP